jgi:hypothetical protein
MSAGKIEKILKVVTVFVFVVQLLIFAGCAAESARMIPTNMEVENKFPYSVTVAESVGGRETNPLWTSQISNTAYTNALSEAIAESGVFEQVIKGQGADYILDVTLLKYDQPVIGIDFDVKMKTKWVLTDTKTMTPVWSDEFETTYRAKLTDAAIAAERLQKANEGSARVNIAEGIKRLSKLQL